MKNPDVLGFLLEDALDILGAAGYRVAIRETAPPRGAVGGSCRVLRVSYDGSAAELLVAGQGWDEPLQPELSI